MLCANLNTNQDVHVRLVHAWEVMAQKKSNVSLLSTTCFYKLTAHGGGAASAHTSVDGVVLESAYFGAQDRVRCSLELLVHYKETSYARLMPPQLGSDTSSSYVFRSSATDIIADIAQQHQQHNSSLEARGDYLLALDGSRRRLVRLRVDVPYVAGFMPLVSTTPLAITDLTDDADADATCSTFSSKSSPTYGFFATHFANTTNNNNNKPVAAAGLRNEASAAFYAHLSDERRSWTFTTYHSISELTNVCGARVISTPFNNSSSSSDDYLVSITLHVAQVAFDASRASWFVGVKYPTRRVDVLIASSSTSASLESSVEENAPPLFGSDHADEEVRPVQIASQLHGSEHLVSLSVLSAWVSERGRLVVEFATIASFYGQFVLKSAEHTSTVTTLLAGSGGSKHDDFDLELTWSQPTFDYPEQTWTATSTSELNVSRLLNFNYRSALISRPVY